MKKRLSRNAIKESLDNLPAGICYFNHNGLPVLCNRQMHRLVYEMTGNELQMLSDLTNALDKADEMDGGVIQIINGTAWKFKAKAVIAEEKYIQYVATDVTELYYRKRELEKSTSEYAKVVDGVKKIADNVVAITREEEILALKMRVHSKVGICLQQLGNYFKQKDLMANKEATVISLRETTGMLRHEIGHDDEPNVMDELIKLADCIGVGISFDREIPQDKSATFLLAEAVRECITNTLRHAHGDKVHVVLTYGTGILTATITNNGDNPTKEIVEGGGLSSLRKRIEKSGGSMEVQSLPCFELKVVIPNRIEVEPNV